ncbi:hypothetical protein [Streptomyces sp. NPDC046161]|uniref:hypothetical protein n=1 Tax=Streptomyces sp. NPDC046161 TaxID=3155132 RepID=UPI0034075736
MTWREFAAYVAGLPPHARVRTALNGGRPEPSVDQLILADLADLLQRLQWTLQAVNSEKGKAPKAPKPYPRQWLQPKPSKSTSPDRVARIEDARRRARERKSSLAG